MKTVVLAGGVGQRLGGTASPVPKLLTCIGGRPVLWHRLRYYVHFGFDDFVVASGHRADEIHRWV